MNQEKTEFVLTHSGNRVEIALNHGPSNYIGDAEDLPDRTRLTRVVQVSGDGRGGFIYKRVQYPVEILHVSESVRTLVPDDWGLEKVVLKR
jgi:hypothetical protein